MTAVSGAESTSAPTSSSSSSGISETSAPASASATANASTTVVINVNSHSDDGDASSGLTSLQGSSEGELHTFSHFPFDNDLPVVFGFAGVSTGTVFGIVAGSIAEAETDVEVAFLRRFLRHSTSHSARGQCDRARKLHASARDPGWRSDQQLRQDGEPRQHREPRLHVHFESSAASVTTKKSTKSSSNLWVDEAILAARIPMEKLIRKELINEGGHGEVYHGLYRGECVAIKVLLPEKRKDMRQTNNFLSEIKMMAMVEHPRIVRFVGVAWDALSDLSAVSEFMPGGDLFPLLLLLNVLPSGGIALANDAVKERVRLSLTL
ncbi:hypothetical protein ON010_g19070 [Phytophthora cinnamomi]|nr:hypothetical protein ON010_g19070 [Phytophthora cinnamomi]